MAPTGGFQRVFQSFNISFVCRNVHGELLVLSSCASYCPIRPTYLRFHDLGDDAILIRLHQDVAAPEGPAAAAPADPAQPETLHGVLTGQRGHAPLQHFETGNRRKVSTCSTETHQTHLTHLTQLSFSLPSSKFCHKLNDPLFYSSN